MKRSEEWVGDCRVGDCRVGERFVGDNERRVDF